ncbi:hypothetical protein CEP54_014706 [Fusarium duplospermum]|uniref:Mitochondrial division protein 1 n=1 Tax=Fusarium duplospermum TaxID=1325734 RepID=A0A428NUF8_9HYPO|nr:hypothetical protein CEP54_014706 [Fusarium duplospermum]
MEGLGVAANVIAVVDLSAKVTSACAAYLKAVKNAKTDIERLQNELRRLDVVLHGAERLVKSPNGSKLQTMEQLEKPLSDASSQLQTLITRLEEKQGKTRRAMSRFGFRAFKWPFESSEVDSIIRGLEKSRDDISMALAIDSAALDIETHSNVQHISSNVQHISSGVQHIGRILDMSKIPVVKGAAFDSHTNEHDPMCLPNTRVELRQTIITWAEDPCSDTIFWLNGMAGTGKSTISRTIARSFAERSMLGASFFFKRGERDRGNASRLFTTLAAHLITRVPEMGPLTIKAIEDEPYLPNKFIQEQFEKLILGPLRDLDRRMSTPRVLVLVIDALDECDRLADARLIINILTRLGPLNLIKLKAFVTSRPELPIRLGFDDVKGKYRDLILHEIPKPIIEHDISEFFQHQLGQARLEYNRQSDPNGQLGPEWPGTHATNELIQMAIPLFIFAATICRFIQDPFYDPLTQLEKALRYKSSAQDSEMQKLDTTYRPTLDQMIADRPERAKENLLSNFRDVVGVIILLAEPLSISNLSRLVGTPIRDIQGLLRHLHSVLSVPNSLQEPVRMLHLSFHDFLVDKDLRETNPFWIDEQETHYKISTMCLDLMCSASHLKQDICDLGWPGTRRTDIKQEDIDLKLPDHVRYSCLYWTHHLEGSGLKIADSHPAFDFLKDYFLFWLEALALLGEVHNCSSMIASIQSVVDPKHGSELFSFLRDAARFVTRFDTVIDEYPLQIYASGLVFAPAESIVKTTFRKCIPEWITQMPQVPKAWDATLRVIETSLDSKSAMSFLPDGRSLRIVSEDGMIQVWDTMTGKQSDSVKADGGHQMVFSLDGECSLSKKKDKSALVWVTSTGTIYHSPNHPIECLALSSDGKQAAFDSFNGSALVTDYRESEMRQQLYGEGREVHKIAFSPNGTLLAVAQDDMMQLWDLNSGQKTEEFLVTRGPWNICFSADSTLIATYHSSCVVVHDVRTGRVVQTLGNHSEGVTAMTFSPNGRHLATASAKVVRLWDLATGKEVQRLDDPSNNIENSVSNVVFSPDSSLLAVSSQGTILVWDPTITNDADSSSGDARYICHLALSQDGSQVASTSEDRTVGIWDVNTAKNIKVMTGSFRETIFGMSFSTTQENGLRMVSYANLVQCHNPISGQEVWVERFGDESWMRACVFSPDGNSIALVYSQVAKIWDLSTRKIQHTLEARHIGVFSPDSRMFVSVTATNTEEVIIWDLTSGRPKQRLNVGLRGVGLKEVSALSLHGSTLAVAISSTHLPYLTFWDINTAACLSKIRLGGRIRFMEFNTTGSHLITERGEVKLPLPNPHGNRVEGTEPRERFEGYGATESFAWITWKSRPLMWLPPSHRPMRSPLPFRASFFIGSTVILGSNLGLVSILKFVETPPWAT